MAHVDGGARGNPGPAGYGLVMEDESGREIARLSEYLGHGTNNYAEYRGLLAALQSALDHGAKALRVLSDSELLVRQMNGQYKVKSPALLELHRQARSLAAKLEWFGIEHVPREQNREADRLANQAMDRGAGLRSSSAEGFQQAGQGGGQQELNGVVRNGVIELLGGELPEGTLVKVRKKQ